MAGRHDGEREDNTPRIPTDTPLQRHDSRGAHDHACDNDDGGSQGEPEPFEDFRNFLEEIRTLHFLDGRRPRDVVRKQMREDSLTNRDAQATKEEKEERNPHEVSEEAAYQVLVPKTVFQEGIPNSSGPEENDGGGEPDLETRDVEAVDGELEPKQDVVDDADGDRGRDTV